VHRRFDGPIRPRPHGENGFGHSAPWSRFERYLCIWRCQNRYEAPKDWGNAVERCQDGFYGLGTLRFRGGLSFQLDFQLQKLVVAQKMGFSDRDARLFLPNSGAMALPG